MLLRTPNSALWNTSDGFHTDYTYLTEGGAKFLVGQGVKVVGVDYLSVEQFKKAGAPAHKALLGNGVIIIEGLNLSDAEAGQYEMYCLPAAASRNADGAPAEWSWKPMPSAIRWTTSSSWCLRAASASGCRR